MDADQIADEIRLKVLNTLNATPGKRVDLVDVFGEDMDEMIPELEYLRDHGLIDIQIYGYMSGEPGLTPAKITTAGRDFLHKTGGIGAELSVVTVRLHEDTVRQLLISRVRESDADDTVKGKLVDQLKALPAEAVSKLAERALDQALRYMPNAIQWLQTEPWS
ncbi:hypothetical protein ACIGEO_02905 [Stenotrophomonas bentonitica]|uniref:hypothetical protein n=1 Tax=Stenotrophomonas bentonitica TaxID=1450134 RepID=UPI0037D19C24